MIGDGFQRAFVATAYLLGARGAQLTAPLPSPARGTRELARRLEHPERAQRAQALAPELARLVAALEARRLA